MCVNIDTAAMQQADIDALCQGIVDIMARCVSEGIKTEGDVVMSDGTPYVHRFSNNQLKPYRFYWVTRIHISLQLRTRRAPGSFSEPQNKDAIFKLLDANIQARYALGSNFEPEQYFNIRTDAPWASTATLEYSFDGNTWHSEVYESDFRTLLYYTQDDFTWIRE